MPKKGITRGSTNTVSAPRSHVGESPYPPTAVGLEEPEPSTPGNPTSQEPRRRSGRSASQLESRALSFGVVGGLVAVIGFIVLYVLVQYVGLNKSLAYFIQAVVSIELNFFLNRSVTWRDRRGSGFKAFAGMWARFHVTRIFTIALNQVLFGLFVYIGINYLIANGLCIAIIMVINFFVGERFIFRSRPIAASMVEVLTADLINPEFATEPQLTSVLRPRTLPATGWPTVSVVVPVGHNKYGLEPTVTSLLQQDYPGELEIILVGGKDDPAWNEIRWYIDDNIVTVIEADSMESSVSIGAERMAGIMRANGHVVAAVDSGMVVPSQWVSAGVEGIRSGWPCVTGPTSVLSGAAVTAKHASLSELKGRVLDPERFVEATYVPPIAANMFVAGDVLPIITSSKTHDAENGEDVLEWLWNLAQADVAVFETQAIRATLARSLNALQILKQYIGAGAAMARFARVALNTPTLPHQRIRLAGTVLSLVGVLALIVAGIAAPSWPQALGLPESLSRATHQIGLPPGLFVALVAAVCAPLYFIGASIAAIITTGQRRAAMAPFYLFAYSWSMIITGLAVVLRLRGGTSSTKSPRFTVVHSPELAFTRPLPTVAPGPMRRRGIISTSSPRHTPYIPAGEWPSVSVVIPVKANQATIGATINSLVTQRYPGRVEILLVGDVNDPTWGPIRPYIDSGKVRIMEVEIRSANRDANAKRTIGLQHAQGEILALTDSDMVLPAHWISTGVQYILRGWPCVGGPMRGATGSFWDAYADLVSLGSKTPRFVVNRVVDDKRYGLPDHKPPITANVFMTRDALKSAGDFDPTFIHSYEDYSWFWAACKAGVPILCTPTLQADHYHRQGWNRLIRQYTRAGRGCADFVMKFPESPLSKIRVAQWLRVVAMTLGVLGLIAGGVLATVNPGTLGVPTSFAHASIVSLPLAVLDPLALVALVTSGLLALGISNALTVRQARAVIFPFITLIFGLAFSYGMTVELFTKLPGVVARSVIVHRARVATAALYAGVFSIGAVLRLWSIDSRPGFEWDEPVYTSVASYFARTGVVQYKAPIGRSVLYLSHPPFYFIMLGEWFRVVGSGITQARIFSALMSLVMITLLFMYLHQRIGRWALLPVLLVAVDGWIVFANRISWIDNSVVAFGILSVWAYFYALRHNTTRAYIFAGLALGFTLVFKQLGIYFCAIPVLNWLLSRQRTRGHLTMLGTIGTCALLYVTAMIIVYKDVFVRQTLSQVFRSSGTVTSRGVVANPQDVITALAGQYHIFAFTVLLCGASLVWLTIDIVRSIRRKDASWLRRYSLEASWIIAGIGVFIAIQIKFPNYFIYLMVPLLVYLGMRVRDVTTRWLAADIRHPQLLRVGLVAVLMLAVCCDLGASYLRLVSQNDNALLQAADYITANVPAHDIVLADEPVGVMIPQKYCKLETAGSCPNVKWVVTYTSITQKLPTQASDPQLYVLLQSAQVITVFQGFKETITVYRVTGDGVTSSTPSTTIGTPTVTPSPAVATATPVQAVPTETPTPVVPTVTPTPVEPTVTPTPVEPTVTPGTTP